MPQMNPVGTVHCSRNGKDTQDETGKELKRQLQLRSKGMTLKVGLTTKNTKLFQCEFVHLVEDWFLCFDVA